MRELMCVSDGGIELAASALSAARSLLRPGTLSTFLPRIEDACLIDVNAANYLLTASPRQKKATPLRFLSSRVVRHNCTHIL